MRIITVEATTHGRVLIDDAAGDRDAGWIVAFHGYGQNADDMLTDVRKIPGADRWRLASVQALNRFYTKDEGIVANWMTRQDRELAIEDNLAYVDKAIDALPGGFAPRLQGSTTPRLVLIGFSQGAAMAYRAGMLGRHKPDGVIALGGDVPPDVAASLPRRSSHERANAGPNILIGAGTRDRWYTREKVDHDVALLRACGADYELVHFDAAHEWTDEFRTKAGEWLEKLRTS